MLGQFLEMRLQKDTSPLNIKTKVLCLHLQGRRSLLYPEVEAARSSDTLAARRQTLSRLRKS
jgi:hypothetical protein